MTAALAAGTTSAQALALGALPIAAALCASAVPLARGRLDRLATPAAICATLSLATAFGYPATGVRTAPAWKLAEAALLLVLLAAVVRWSPWREARIVAPLTAVATAAWPFPLVDGPFLERTGAAAFWLLPAVAAAAAGAYPRRVELRRRAAVTEARRAQRLQLSRDLHDFVAHDISGIVVQAQAARFVAATDPAQAVLALERIEKAGLNALESMDRTVEMLHGPARSPAAALPGLDHLPSLVDEFTAAGGIDAELRLPPETAEALSREAGAAAYRIVVEALTNVRRHAPAATLVRITLTPTPASVELQVSNDAPGTPRVPLPRRRATRGGLGLPALTEHAEALGGTLTAGPHGAGGWRLTATLPRTTAPASAPAPVPAHAQEPQQ
ncbi:sensor histidine kinase [Streptomyces formicae]|uniref:histidine kinase n=1 Tax=Streptomyces formicae TaxID=1616117 RepID=A0A291QBW4_9ACTN|nr:histidine kinase [Streptomyces formicae]ATL28964.1 Two-component system sensor kinase [Streptomyces formicae]